MVERHRGGRSTGSEPYLWSLTRRGFERLRSAWRPIIGEKGDPIPWLLGAKAKFNPWGWAERPWGSAMPGRLGHDLAALDFLISYRRAVDAALAGQAPGSYIVSEWRAEHVFLAPLAEPDRDGERFPMTVSCAVARAFDRYREPTRARGFDDQASLQVVKPDAALSLVIIDPGGQQWTTLAQLPPWERERVFPGDYPHHLVVDVLIEFDRTGRVSDNIEKLRGLDMFLNVGRRLVHENPVICLGHSYLHEGYTADVVVLFVCPPGRAMTMMRGADEILTGHLWRDGEVSYEGRNRILFCESDAFGNLTADLVDRERWLRLPAGRRPAPPKAREGSRRMWLLPELPPGQRETSEMLPRVWEDPEMIAVLPPDEADEMPF